MLTEPKTHQLTSYKYEPIDGGLQANMSGEGLGITPGDYLILQNGNDTTRYRVVCIEYRDDQWKAFVEFAPRPWKQ